MAETTGTRAHREGGFDVGAQRRPHNGVAVEDEDEVWEERDGPFDHWPRLPQPGLNVNGLETSVQALLHGVYGGIALIRSTTSLGRSSFEK